MIDLHFFHILYETTFHVFIGCFFLSSVREREADEALRRQVSDYKSNLQSELEAQKAKVERELRDQARTGLETG